METHFILPRVKVTLEKWKWNEQFCVYVSTLGNFKDENKKDIKVKINKSDGYTLIPTAIGNEFAHRLVMKTWKPIQETTMTIDHLNHNKRDNRLCNLEWVTGKENIRRANEDLTVPTCDKIDSASWFKIRLKNGKVKHFSTYKQMIDYTMHNGFYGQRSFVEANVRDCILNNKSWGGCRWYAY